MTRYDQDLCEEDLDRGLCARTTVEEKEEFRSRMSRGPELWETYSWDDCRELATEYGGEKNKMTPMITDDMLAGYADELEEAEGIISSSKVLGSIDDMVGQRVVLKNEVKKELMGIYESSKKGIPSGVSPDDADKVFVVKYTDGNNFGVASLDGRTRYSFNRARFKLYEEKK